MKCKISWDPEDLRSRIEHSDLIETFIKKYIIEQKQITPKPNTILLKHQIKHGEYLTSDIQDISAFLPSFENIILYSLSEDTNEFYTLHIRGKTKEDISNEGIRIGDINYAKKETDDEILELLYFAPEERGNLHFRDINAKRIVQLIYDPKLGYSDSFHDDVQIFNPQDGSMILLEKR